ncbi:MAG: enoyl-CoA hydratase [Burkholderiales bacterium]
MAHVSTEVKNRITFVALNLAEKKNALTAQMYRELAQAIASAEGDSQVRAILIHGQQDCFCAGNDLKDFLDHPPHSKDSPVFVFLQQISSATKPIVAAVSGVAVGIGTTMLLHCDLVYASPDARFRLPFTSLGLVPEAASSLLLPMMAGYHRAAELLLLGKPFDVDKALSAGIVTGVVGAEELLAHASGVAAALAALPPASVRLTKRLMKQHDAANVGKRIVEESEVFRERLDSPEAKEAFTAFLEKREPDFSRF